MPVIEVFSVIGSVAAMGIGLAVLIVHSTARLERRIDRLEDALCRRIDRMVEGQAAGRISEA